MWVELIGLPGVGKTTLVENNLSFIASKFRIIRSNSPSILHRGTAKILYQNIYRNGLTNQDLAKKLAYRDSFRFFLHKERNMFFYDSGLIQVLLEHFIEDENTSIPMMEKAISLIDLPHKVIFVDDDIERISRRESKRSPRRFMISKPKLIARYQSAQNFIETFLFQRIPNIQVVRIGSQIDNEFCRLLQKDLRS